MAKKSVIARQRKRERTVERYALRRSQLKAALRAPSTSVEERWQLQQQFKRLPRDASPVRLRNRCQITGRARGVYRMFGLARSLVRLHAMRGELPGLRKSSW
jgi:small subunit ribosomal protein S14